MRLRIWLDRVVAVFTLAGIPASLRAQEPQVQRVANIVSVAVEEYGKGIDAKGRLISQDEYQEAVGFFGDARIAAARLPSDRAANALVVLDSIIGASSAKKPPAVLADLADRFSVLLGRDAQLTLPTRAADLAEGEKLFQASCASCHGPRGMGDGLAGAALSPKPPAIGSEAAMHAVAPAMMFRKISVGVTGTAMPAFSPQLSDDQRWNVVAYLSSLQHPPQRVAEGEGLFVQGCVACHGVTGMGDGAAARTLTRMPPDLGSFAWQAERSDSQLVAAVRDGKIGTPMPPAQLAPVQLVSIVAYLRSLPGRQRMLAAVPAASDHDSATIYAHRALALLDQSLTAASNAQMSDAEDRAFDAYLAFEPIEGTARARDPGVVSSMERLFAEFKAAVHTDDLRGAEHARDAIEAGMDKVVQLTRPAGSCWEAFMQSLLIILREGFEAILVIGAVVAFLLKTGHRERLKSIWTGIAWALVASGLTAVVLRTALKAIPASQEIIEGLTLLVAVGVLFSVSYWLISRVEAAKWRQFIREKVDTALDHGGGRALALVAFLAVYREGAETALFYQALFNEGTNVALPIALGIVTGFAALAVIFTLFYRYGVRIPLRPFFSVTSVLLYYMAFVFMGTGIRELQEGNAISITPIRGLPTVEALGFYPTWQTVLGQMLLAGLFVFAVAKTFWPKRSVALPTVVSEPVTPAAPGESPAVTARLDELRSENEELRRRVSEIEDALQERTVRDSSLSDERA
ncbi:MAG: FTR1 family protein [Gemmatimonadaceae bacterium]